MKLDFTNAATPSPVKTGPSRMKPGIHPKVIITEISAVEGPGSPYIKVDLTSSDGEGVHTERLYMSEKALPYSLGKLKEMATAAGVNLPEEMDVNALNMILSNKEVAFRLYGREIMRTDGAGTAVVSEFAPSPFCLPVGQESKFSYNSEKAVKKLKIEGLVPDNTAGDDLPF